MDAKKNNRRWLRLGLGACFGVLLIFGGVWAFNNLDLERHRYDLNRLEKLARVEIPLVNSQSEIRNPNFQDGDWPQWRGPNRDGLSLETDLCRNWSGQDPPEIWRTSIGRGFSSVVVVGHRLYTMDEESDLVDAASRAAQTPSSARLAEPTEGVLCIDAQTGRKLWRFHSPVSYSERFGSGPRSTPTFDGNHVYAVGATGLFYSLRADTGELLWQHDLMAEFNGRPMRYGVAFSPLVENDLVITTPGGPDGNALVAFDKYTGEVVWKSLDDTMGYSSPMAATLAGVHQLLIFTNTALVSLSPLDGHVNWRYPWETLGGFNIATPLTFGDCIFISSGYGKGCALLEVTREPDGSLKANQVYEHNRMRNHFASSVRWGEHLYGFDQTDLVCMEIRTGKIVWREKGFRNFGKGSLLIADGQLIVLGESGKLYFANATPTGYSEKASIQLSPNKCWTAPIVAHGKLYVRTESEIICLDLRQSEKDLQAHFISSKSWPMRYPRRSP